MMVPKYRPIDLDTMARTLFGEARGEGRKGMEAVAAVIMTRARNPGWWGRDVQGCCLARSQFSCWSISDPNRNVILSVDQTDPVFREALAIARDALEGRLPDPTKGADSYCNMKVARPSWATPDRWTCDIGKHSFFITRNGKP